MRDISIKLEIKQPEDKLKSLFKMFWELYPRKISREEALKAWIEINPDPHQRTCIANKIFEMGRTGQWCREDGRFIPAPAKFLNDKSWDDGKTMGSIVAATERQLKV